MTARGARYLGLAMALAGCATSDPPHCAGPGSYVDVDTAAHRLYLCEDNEAQRAYDVRLGWGGVGKTTEGDQRTPLGEYPLGAARASTKYGTFVPIGYPTAEQKAKGFTGSAVGVHGPDRRYVWLGSLTNTLDTTDGCVGLATDAEMSEVSAWLRANPARSITLR